jgi:biopolymer transport protein ExbD
MQYEVPPRRRSTGTVIVVVLLLGFLLLVGLAVLGAGLLVFASARAHEVRMIVRQDVARQVEEARARAEEARARAENIRERLGAKSDEPFGPPPQAVVEAEPAETPEAAGSIRIANREVTIQLDEGGKIQVDGTACELSQLKDLLAKAGEGRENAMVVVVNADKRCLFEHVAAVLAVCKELNLPLVRVGTLGN